MPDSLIYTAPSGREFALGWHGRDAEAAARATPQYRRLYTAPPRFAAPPGGFPKRFTLQKFRRFPHDQGPVGTCWNNAGIQVAQVMTAVKAAAGKPLDVVQLSRAYNGHYGCKLMGGGNPANGGTISAAMMAQADPPDGFGNCHESVYPYKADRHYLGQTPPAAADEDARHFHLHQVSDVPCTVEDWQGAIYAGHPIDVGLSWPSNFDDHGPFFDSAGWGVGGHSIIVYGWYERNGTLYWHCDNSHGGIYGVLEKADFADFQGYDPDMHPEFSFFASDPSFRPRVARDGEAQIAADLDGFDAPTIDWSQMLSWS